MVMMIDKAALLHCYCSL